LPGRRGEADRHGPGAVERLLALAVTARLRGRRPGHVPRRRPLVALLAHAPGVPLARAGRDGARDDQGSRARRPRLQARDRTRPRRTGRNHAQELHLVGHTLRSPTRWPKANAHSGNSSTSSGPSSTGSVSTFDPPALEQRVVTLEAEMNAPGFWDDQARAAKVAAEHARVTRRLDGYRTLVHDYEDARELAELDGGEMEAEIASGLAPLLAELEQLQENALFDGEYDAGDAVMTLQS